MFRLRFSTLLIAINVGLLLLAVAGVASAAVQLLQRLSDEQALARVTQVGLVAQREVANTGSALHSTAQLLAERPTLRRLLDAQDTAGLAAFLAQFRQTSQLDSCVVLRDNTLVAQGGVPLPWRDLYSARDAADGPFLAPTGPDQPLLLGDWAPVPGLPGTAVGVARLLDAEFVRQISGDDGTTVQIVPAARAAPDAAATLRSEVVRTGQPAAARQDVQRRYVAVVPLQGPAGVVGLVEAGLPTEPFEQSLHRLTRSLLMLAFGVAALLALVSLFIGRRFVRPLGALTAAADRIGHGDLATPIPTQPRGEIGALATTLEEMRWRLQQLTDDLRQQQAASQAILTGIAEGVFSVDRERRIRYLNPQTAALLGIRADQAIGRFCGDVLQPIGPNGERPCAHHCPILHARFRGSARATEHLALRNGTQRTMVITSAAADTGAQMQIIRDETDIEATRRLRDVILANISHEFRTPLSAQLASIELLLDQLPDLTEAQTTHLIRSLQRGTLRLTQLIDNLLESARLEAGQVGIRRQVVALDEVVEVAGELVRPLLQQRDQHLAIDVPYPLPHICGDAPRLTQVLVNLLANANKFAPSGSTIRIDGLVMYDHIALSVEDEGPGMPAVEHGALFQRFVRAGSDEPEQSGAGLGLWLVKSIVERHGGHVTAQSSGRGTRMTIVLPREHSHEDSGG